MIRPTLLMSQGRGHCKVDNGRLSAKNFEAQPLRCTDGSRPRPRAAAGRAHAHRAWARSRAAGGRRRTDDEYDPANLASDLYQDELDETFADDLNEQLAALERAEARLAAGTYGLSVESGEPIPDARLEALAARRAHGRRRARAHRPLAPMRGVAAACEHVSRSRLSLLEEHDGRNAAVPCAKTSFTRPTPGANQQVRVPLPYGNPRCVSVERTTRAR